MKNCKRCGRVIADDADFCAYCGEATGDAGRNTDDNTVKSVVFGKDQNSFAGIGDAYGPAESYGALPELYKRVRKVGSSFLLLTYIILTVLVIMINIFSVFPINSAIRTLSDYWVPTEVLITLGTVIFSAVLILMLPNALAALGLTVFYVDCRSHVRPSGKGLGLLIASKVVSIIYQATGTVAMLVLFVALSFLGPPIEWLANELQYEVGIDSSTISLLLRYIRPFLVVLFFIVLLIVILAIIYNVTIISGSMQLKDNLRAGFAIRRLPVYPVIYAILSCAISIFGISKALLDPSSIIFGYSLPSGMNIFMVMSNINYIIRIVAVIISIILLFMIRNAARRTVR